MNTSLELVNGKPAISYYEEIKQNLTYVQASDVNGATWNIPVAVDNVERVGVYGSLELVNGKPAISYWDVTNSDLKFIQAGDVDGTDWSSLIILFE